MATGFNTQVSNGEYRLQFETDNKEYYLLMQETARRCVDGKTVTNADRVRSMSDEELAVFLSRDLKQPCDYCQLEDLEGACTETLCDDAMMKWLQHPAEKPEEDAM